MWARAANYHPTACANAVGRARAPSTEATQGNGPPEQPLSATRRIDTRQRAGNMSDGGAKRAAPGARGKGGGRKRKKRRDNPDRPSKVRLREARAAKKINRQLRQAAATGPLRAAVDRAKAARKSIPGLPVGVWRKPKGGKVTVYTNVQPGQRCKTVGTFTLEQIESGFAEASLDAQLAYERTLIDAQAGWQLYGAGKGKTPAAAQWSAWNKAADAAHAGVLVRREFSENRRDGDAYRLCKAQRRARREATQVAKARAAGGSGAAAGHAAPVAADAAAAAAAAGAAATAAPSPARRQQLDDVQVI